MKYLSLFSGMECAHQAWASIGWKCVGVSEIEPNACALLAHRLPDVPNLGSVTGITDAQIAALGHIDVVIGGSPCQDLSVAGKRAGLGGARSSLFHEQLRIFHAARKHCGARWLIWENVPGAFSSHAGRDFAVVVGSMAGADLVAPADGWGSEGMAVGENGLVEWCVLDAQWFGVAQRRRRVFAVLDTGDWASRPPVLLERDGLRGDFAPRREAGKDVAPTISARTSGGGGLGTDFDCDGGLIPTWPAQVAPTLAADFGDKMGLSSQHIYSQSGGASSLPSAAACLTTGTGRRYDPETETPIPTIGGVFDVDPIAFDTTRITGAENGSNPKSGDPCHPLAAGAHAPATAFSCKDHGADAGEVSPTLRSMGHDGSHANAGGQVAVAFAHQGGGVQTTLGYDSEAGTAPTLSVCQTPAVHHAMAVRRLTPTECERLQGVEDGWTLVPNKHGKPMADGPRYKLLGNSFARPCITWIGRQIERAESYALQAAA